MVEPWLRVGCLSAVSFCAIENKFWQKKTSNWCRAVLNSVISFDHGKAGHVFVFLAILVRFVIFRSNFRLGILDGDNFQIARNGALRLFAVFRLI